MSKRSHDEYLKDIQEAIKRIRSYTNDLPYAEFIKDTQVQDAVVRNLEIIGEASKSVAKKAKDKSAQIPWSEWAKVRDKLIHHYFCVNLDIVWGIIEESLPAFSD